MIHGEGHLLATFTLMSALVGSVANPRRVLRAAELAVRDDGDCSVLGPGLSSLSFSPEAELIPAVKAPNLP